MSEPTQTGFFRGAGGGVFELPLPLSENMHNQLVRGELVPVNADGSPLEEAPPELARPATNAAKNEWVAYAVQESARRGKPLTVDDADAMTKADLIERFGQK